MLEKAKKIKYLQNLNERLKNQALELYKENEKLREEIDNLKHIREALERLFNLYLSENKVEEFKQWII